MISAMQKTRMESRNPVIKQNLQFNAESHGMCQNLEELIKSRSLYLNQIAIWTSICKYYAAKVDFNMNPACSEWME